MDRQRWHKLHKCWAKFCSSKLWPKTKFALVHLSYEEVVIFVHRRVLWPRSFLIFIMWWTEELYNQQPSLVGDSSHVLGSAKLVSHILGVMHWRERLSIQNKSNWVLGEGEIVMKYVFHMLGTYVAILCNSLIFWQNAFYLYLGRSKMCLMLQGTRFQIQVLKPCKSVQESSVKNGVH